MQKCDQPRSILLIFDDQITCVPINETKKCSYIHGRVTLFILFQTSSILDVMEDDEEIHFTHYGKTQREKRKSS